MTPTMTSTAPTPTPASMPAFAPVGSPPSGVGVGDSVLIPPELGRRGGTTICVLVTTFVVVAVCIGIKAIVAE